MNSTSSSRFIPGRIIVGAAALITGCVAVAHSFASPAAPAPAPAPVMVPLAEADDVRHAMMRFYDALNGLFEGKLEPMEACWSHGSDVLYMGPMGGMEVGWENIQKMWKQQADAKIGGKVKPTNPHGIKGQDLAVVIVVEEGENTNVDGKTQKVSIRATNTFRLENGEWKMIGHHTDILPMMEKAAAAK